MDAGFLNVVEIGQYFMTKDTADFSQFTDDFAQEDLLQRYPERVDKQSQQNRVIKLCTDSGFLATVDVGQYFRTEDTADFSQITDAVAFREYTSPREEKSSEPKG